MNISTDFDCLKLVISNAYKGLNLRGGTSLILFLSEIFDIHNPPQIRTTKIVKVYDLLLKKGLLTR